MSARNRVRVKVRVRSSAADASNAATVVRASPRVGDADFDPYLPGAESTAGLVDEGEIGAGGSGSVRKSYDPKLRREVATKVLAPDLVKSPAYMRRFVGEARMMARLDHPNVVPVHDLVVEDRKTGYIVMKLVRGRTLEEIVTSARSGAGQTAAGGTGRRTKTNKADNQSDPPHRLLSAFLKVCDALAFAHSRRIIHCDLKPANIMVGEFGEVYLMDWGIAEDADAPAARAVRTARGTPAYMAPEQAAGKLSKITERTDVFGLGTVLYFIATGRPPFEADTISQSLSRARAGRFTDVDEAAPVPPAPGLTRIIRKAMATNPADRYASVVELREEVDMLLRSDWSLPTKVFSPGAVIVKEGAWADAAYIIVRGRCSVSKTVDGKVRQLRTLRSGAVFGEAGILSGNLRTATVQAVDTVTVKLVTRKLFEEKLGSQTWFGKFVLALADRFRELDQQVNRPPRVSGAVRKRATARRR